MTHRDGLLKSVRRRRAPAQAKAARHGCLRSNRVSDDAGAGPSLGVDSAAAHSRDAIGELGLPEGSHFREALIAVHRTRLHIHRRDDIVAAAGIKQQIPQQIPPSRTLPQVVMRIDDRQFGFKNRFFAPSSQSGRTGLDGPACCCADAPPLPRGRRAAKESGEFASVH